MLRIAIVVLLVLHGLVHLWYVVLAQRLVDVTPAMGWSAESGAIPAALGDAPARWVATVLYVAAALVIVAGGAGVATGADWARPLLVSASVLSTATILLFWDGSGTRLVEQGLLGVVINGVIAVVALRMS